MEKRKEKTPLKQRRKEEGGITLIALVITIIVLLILAGVTIATLTGENGILTKAGDAKTSTEIGDEREKVELSAVGALAKDNGGEIKRDYLNDELTSYIGIEGTDYTLSETAPFVVKYLDSGRSYVIAENGNVSEYVNIAEYVKIGDLVNYTPDDKEDDEYYDKFGETYSGYANGNIGQDDDLKWKVLNINTDGTVDLISDKPTSTKVYFKGARGYNNGVYLLNDYCKTMYSNSSLGAEARSLNIEDIQDKMKIVDEETGKKAYENYASGTGTKYGNTYSYSSNKWYPLQWKNDNGITGESKQETVTSYETETDAKAQETTSDLIVTQTYWNLSSSDMQTNFISADTRDASKSSSMYYELLCNNGSSYYWLASRYVYAADSSYSQFGLRYVYYGSVIGNIMFLSYGSTNYYHSYYVRPVVSLKSNIIDTDVGYNETTGWSLK